MRSRTRQEWQLKPFHESILDALADKGFKTKSASVDRCKRASRRLVYVARTIATTKCPKNRTQVGLALAAAIQNMGGLKSKYFSAHDRSMFYHAFDALKAQDREERQKQQQTETTLSAHASEGEQGEKPAATQTDEPPAESEEEPAEEVEGEDNGETEEETVETEDEQGDEDNENLGADDSERQEPAQPQPAEAEQQAAA